MKNNQPLISIITVVYNGEAFLEQTIKSVINQTYKNIEYIIIDGGSTDGTLDIIKRYEDKIDYSISEKDDGIYDAMNKGIKVASGEFIAFINADDWYERTALESIAGLIISSGAEFISANIRIINLDNNQSIVRRSTFEDYGKNVHHQTCFIKTNIHKNFIFNTKYKLAADRDLIVRLIKNGTKTAFLDEVVANFREGGMGSDILRYQKELFDSNRNNIGLIFAINRVIKNIIGRTLFNILQIRR